MLLAPLPFEYVKKVDPGDRIRRARKIDAGVRVRRLPPDVGK